MTTLNDAIRVATGGGTVNDGLLNFFKAGGASANATYGDAERQWLLTQLGLPVTTPDTNQDLWMRLLPAPGTLNDRQLAYWLSNPSANIVSELLFGAGEPGFWYDYSDFSTMWQDTIGVPVTAVEQPVGLVLDKKLDLALGSNLRSGFVPAVAGTPPAVATYNSGTGAGTAARTDAVNTSFINLPGLTTGSVYRIRVTNTGAAQFSVRTSGSAQPVGSVDPGVTATITFVVLGANVAVFPNTNGTTIAFTVESVMQVLGNHASQTTAGFRPVLSARKNYAVKTEQLEDAAWIKQRCTVTVNQFSVLDRVTEDATAASTHRLVHPLGSVSTGLIALSCEFKAETRTKVRLSLENNAGTSNVSAWADLSTGTIDTATSTVGTDYTGATSAITSVGGGVYRLEVRCTGAVAGIANAIVFLRDAGGNVGYNGDNTSSLLAGRLQLEYGVAASTRYQRVNTSTDYDTAGFPHYLKFDGADDFLLTPTVNFATTDTMTVWHGGTKLSDAAQGMVYELSADVGANNGTFAMRAPGAAAAATYNALYDGDVGSISGVIASGFVAPHTAAVTLDVRLRTGGVGSSGNGTIRVNGAPTSAGFTGGGVFGTFPIYIGRRGGTLLPYNGQLNQLIARGAATPLATIQQIEAFVAGKTLNAA